jgi:formylglycine-generating enzyme required for sulfatase activity
LLEADANDFPVIRDALAPYRADLIDGLWKVLEAALGDTRQRFRAAAALASYDPASPHWEDQEHWIAEQLVAQPSLVLRTWVETFKPIKQRLAPALAVIFREQSRLHAGATVTAEVLGDYAAEDPKTLAEALAEAAPSSFAILFGQLQAYTDRAVAELAEILDTAPTGDVPANVIAGRHANSAIALLRLKRGERLWPLLRQSPDPRVRSFLIDRVARMGCDPATILACLESEPDESIRAALWLILGHFDNETLPSARRSPIVPRLQDAYQCDGSAAVHAATHWLMGQWGLRESQRPANDYRRGNPADGEKKWYRTSIGQTMVRISGPLKYEMGPLPDEPGPKDFEKRHTLRIDYSYDIGMTEVTAVQFRLFLKEREDPGRNRPHYVVQTNLSPDKPAIRVSWYDAAAFCNWLSKREGIPRDQWCYEPNEKGEFADGMKIVPKATRKIGYRLPTEAEWEYACRGGAATMRCYGDADELLSRYAWYAANAYDSVQPVARLLPNAYGLFDMHGNTSEWCQDRHPPYAAREGAEIVVNSDMRIVRGGGVNAYPKGIRSARRLADRPIMEGVGGFRIGRSRP